MPTTVGGSWLTYHAISGASSIVSTYVTMIDIPSRHTHSVRRSLDRFAITIAFMGNGLADLHALPPALGDDTTLYATSVSSRFWITITT